MDLAKALQTAIETEIKSGVTQYALAKRAGIPDVTLSRFRSGERSLRLDYASKLAAALGLGLLPLDKSTHPRGPKRRSPTRAAAKS